MVIVAVGVGLLLVVLAWGWWSERRFRTRMAGAKRSRVAGHQAWIQKQRIAQAVAALMIVVAGGGASALRPETEPVKPSTPVATSTPEPGDDFPIRFLEARSDGNIRVRISNESDSDRYVQCLIDASDASGASVLEGTYDAIERDGDEYQSEIYASTNLLPAGDSVPFEIALRVSAPVAQFEGECGAVPRLPKG